LIDRYINQLDVYIKIRSKGDRAMKWEERKREIKRLELENLKFERIEKWEESLNYESKESEAINNAAKSVPGSIDFIKNAIEAKSSADNKEIVNQYINKLNRKIIVLEKYLALNTSRTKPPLTAKEAEDAVIKEMTTTALDNKQFDKLVGILNTSHRNIETQPMLDSDILARINAKRALNEEFEDIDSIFSIKHGVEEAQ